MVAAFLLAASLSISPRRDAAMHPLHTTMAEVSVDRARATLRIVVRVFADDFGTALAASKTSGSWDARTAAYVAGAITVADDNRQPLAMRGCGTRRTGDLLWLCAEMTIAPERTSRLTLRDQMLCELFADQVNVVRVTDGATTRSMLFTRGDLGKRIAS